MSWIWTAWLVIASACVTLAAIHIHVWLRQPQAIGNAAFALLAAGVAGMGYFESRMLLAGSTAEFGRMLWWYHVPVWTAVVALVLFVRMYLRAGHAWLGWAAVGLRTLVLVVNLVSSPNINYREISALEAITVFGEDASFARGTSGPGLLIAHLSLFVLVAFVVDATRDLWKRDEVRRATLIGGSLVLFVTAGTIAAIMAMWGVARVPLFATLWFLPIVVVMGFELSLDLIRAVRLSAELDARTLELRASDQKAALAADAASAGLWSVEAGSGRLWATPRALAMFGLPPVGEHWIDDVLRSVHPDDRDRMREFACGARVPDRRSTIEYRVPDPRGGTRWYASLGRASDGGPAAPGGLMGATIDITERKRVEDETARQRAELEHLSRVATLSELSGALAHELNQPLAIVLSNAEAALRMLEQPDPDVAEIRSILGDIVAADERAGEVIRRLRNLLKRGISQRLAQSLDEVVQAVLRFLRADLIRRGITVDLALAQDLPAVCIDRVPIEQVLINVINNACDAMAGNGAGDRRLQIITNREDSNVRLRVTDNGCGLPASPASVFDAFYTTKPEGLGMGLAISRSIVSAHGGRMWAESNAARGATIHIALPIEAAAT